MNFRNEPCQGSKILTGFFYTVLLFAYLQTLSARSGLIKQRWVSR